MPTSRQAHWKAKFDVAYEVVNWAASPNWAKVPDYSDPFSVDNTYDFADDVDEPDGPWEDEDDNEDHNSADSDDDAWEDDDDDYENDDWVERETERGVLGYDDYGD